MTIAALVLSISALLFALYVHWSTLCELNDEAAKNAGAWLELDVRLDDLARELSAALEPLDQVKERAVAVLDDADARLAQIDKRDAAVAPVKLRSGGAMPQITYNSAEGIQAAIKRRLSGPGANS